ncbi:MAG TPA: histone-lysine N-methyltransferase [Candidatus Desulfovibrio intestinipullorum]|uniref:Histone-lysine N-methyltransferase n=1 Tax=Candidatus Desulfovibrio intestinipullorum TaxID=2838536 RepID=A0A9D1PY58_9BACT|nr:histone-lysine N-methyltransferase [Candidatus Desulfovibrio intestinipullorum]
MTLLRPRILDTFTLQDVKQPQLYRDLYPYTQICRTTFDDVVLAPHPAGEMHITDTTFRDGQQARPPYTVAQIKKMFEFLYRLGGRTGLISASEFFLYSEKDRRSIEVCRSLGYQFPKVTAWIRANKQDLALARDMEFDEVGMLTSVSDYHIFLKLGKTRQQAMDMYVDMARQALEWGIVPRCHFEDITRADIYGFCLPLAQQLMELSRQANMPVKIRLCDTMGYGVPYPGAALPRSVQRLVHAFTDEAGVPGEQLEWHGHNDFHKVLVNGVTAWLYGCGSVNGTLFGFGERTGNTPIEALAIEYISITGDDAAADTRVISEIAEFFEKELKYSIPPNYPFAGRDFNATSAGVHVDGILKNEEIYNIFDTTLLLGKPVPIVITDKSGRAGVAYWINHNLHLNGTGKEVTKKHPSVGKIYNDIMKAYENGRTTHFSYEEMQNLVHRYMPEFQITEYDRMKQLAGELSAYVLIRLSHERDLLDFGARATELLENFARQHTFIQLISLTDSKGLLKCMALTADKTYRPLYSSLHEDFDFSDREWFQVPMQTGDLHIMDVYTSRFTGKLIITVSCAVTDEEDQILGVLSCDMQVEQILKHAQELVHEDDRDEA